MFGEGDCPRLMVAGDDDNIIIVFRYGVAVHLLPVKLTNHTRYISALHTEITYPN